MLGQRAVLVDVLQGERRDIGNDGDDSVVVEQERPQEQRRLRIAANPLYRRHHLPERPTHRVALSVAPGGPLTHQGKSHQRERAPPHANQQEGVVDGALGRNEKKQRGDQHQHAPHVTGGKTRAGHQMLLPHAGHLGQERVVEDVPALEPDVPHQNQRPHRPPGHLKPERQGGQHPQRAIGAQKPLLDSQTVRQSAQHGRTQGHQQGRGRDDERPRRSGGQRDSPHRQGQGLAHLQSPGRLRRVLEHRHEIFRPDDRDHAQHERAVRPVIGDEPQPLPGENRAPRYGCFQGELLFLVVGPLKSFRRL